MHDNVLNTLARYEATLEEGGQVIRRGEATGLSLSTSGARVFVVDVERDRLVYAGPVEGDYLGAWLESFRGWAA